MIIYLFYYLYEIWWYFAVLATIFWIGCAVVLARSDCDLVLQLCCKWGKKPEETLRNKVVWITGASSGIGEYLAYALAECGSILVLSARRKDELEKVLEECNNLSHENKGKHLVLPMDLTKSDEHAELLEIVLKKFGRVDVLVNNAGRSQRSEALHTDLEVDKAIIDLNFVSTVSFTKTVLPSMVAHGSGSLVIVSSVAGKLPSPGSASYSASKHALQGFFDTLRIELSDKNISVLSVCPGPVDTPILNNVLKEKMTSSHTVAPLDKKRVTSERCAYLMTVAMANGLTEIWIALQPILLFTYISQYSPVVARWLGNRIGLKRLKALKKEQ